jgi:hypothetical protein
MLRRDKDSDTKENKKDRALRELSSAVWRNAQEAHGAGQQFFSFLWVLSDASSVFSGMIKRQDYRSPDQLIGEVEQLGWRLESSDTVYVPVSGGGFGSGNHAADDKSGLVQAHFLFRRVDAGS